MKFNGGLVQLGIPLPASRIPVVMPIFKHDPDIDAGGSLIFVMWPLVFSSSQIK